MNSPVNTPIVRIDRLSYQFKQQKVLDNISMQIPVGSIYGFLGPNGAGKTTTLRLLLGLLEKQEGTIRVFGSDMIKNRITHLRKIGSLIEQPSLYLHLTGRENLEVFRLSYQAKRSRIREVLKIVGLTDVANKVVRSYSLGMKQRLAISLAMLHDPELMILDEPTNGLDPAGIIEMRDLILSLNKVYGKTILVSSHLLYEVEKIATDVAIINKGKLIFEGPLSRLREIRSGQSVIEIEVNDLTNAAKVLEKDFTVRNANGKLLVDFISPKHTAQLTALLVNHHIEVYSLFVHRHNLEDLFIHITSE